MSTRAGDLSYIFGMTDAPLIPASPSEDDYVRQVTEATPPPLLPEGDPIGLFEDWLAEADAYFASRARHSQLGAWASDQSQPLPDRLALERRVAEMALKFGLGKVPRPPHWSGYRVVPQVIEFWRDRPFRLHERLVYKRVGEAWETRRLFP